MFHKGGSVQPCTLVQVSSGEVCAVLGVSVLAGLRAGEHRGVQ